LVALRGIFREHDFDMPCAGCECVVKGGCMQGCYVGARIVVRSRRWMKRVTVSTKSTKVGHAARQCRCRRREPMFAGGSPLRMVVAVVDVNLSTKPSKTRNSRKHRISKNSQHATRTRNSQKRRICSNSPNTGTTNKNSQNQNYPQIPRKQK